MERSPKGQSYTGYPTWRGRWGLAGWSLVGVGLAVLFGWLFGIRELVEPVLSSVPVTPVAIIGLFALGLAALALDRRRRLDQQRQHSERRFRAIFDSAYQFEGLLDLHGRIVEANPTALKLLGAEGRIDDLRGTELWKTPGWRSAGVRDRIEAAASRARQGETVATEVELESSSGERVILDFSLKPIRDADGKVGQLLAEGRDITPGRRAESQLREVEALSTMGRLAARVAHEINNPLAGIQNSFLLLRDAIPPSHPHYAYVGAMEREIGRIASVTRHLYETYRPEPNGSGRTGVRTLIGDAVAFLEQVNRPSKVRIRAELEPVPSQVAVPEAVVRQSVYNLVQNAIDASPQGGTVTVRAETTPTMFVLRVLDEGPGIPADLRAGIFQPFSSRDRTVAGSLGIGLFMVERSVKAVGGTVAVGDGPQGGAEFTVRIPLDGVPQGATG